MRFRTFLAAFVTLLSASAYAQTPPTVGPVDTRNIGTTPVTTGATTNSLATWMSYLTGTSNPNPVVFGSTISATNGGTLGGTFSGNHTYSGNTTFSGNNTFNGTGGFPLTLGSATFNNTPLQINGAATGVRGAFWQTAGSNRFRIGMSTEAESGSNAGANLTFVGYSDAGSSIGNSVTVYRASAGIGQTYSMALPSNTTNNGAVQGINLNQTFSGTSAVPAGGVFNSITTNDSVNFTGASNGITGFSILMNYGVGTGGGRVALSATSNQSAAPTGGSDPAFNGVGAAFDARASFNVGGTAATIGSAKGYLFGSNPAVHLQNGATDFVSPIGEEINVVAMTGSSFVRKVGLQVISLLNDVVNGSAGVDVGLFESGGGSQLDYGLMFGDEQGPQPVKSTGTLIGTRLNNTGPVAKATVGWGIDFLQTTMASGLIRGNAFEVDGSGNTYIGFGTIKPDSGGMVIDTGIKHAVSATINAGGSGWTAQQQATDSQGNIWTITPTTGAITSAVLVQAAPSTTAPATTTITPQWFQPNGTGVVLNVTYGTGTNLKLQPTAGGTIQTGSGTWSANASVATALSSVGPTGSHTTVQEWFTVTDAAGTVRYIPAF